MSNLYNKCLKQITPLLVFLVLFILGIAAYFNAINHPFVHDDVVFIQQNPAVRTIDLSTFFSSNKYIKGSGNLINLYYRSLLSVFYSVEYRLFKLNPIWYHLVNIFIHIANAFLIYLILLYLTSGRIFLSFASSSLFLLHPIQSEAVACISGISNVLVTFFMLVSLLLYLSGIKCDKSIKTVLYYIFSILAFILALFTKEQAIVLPFIVILSTIFIIVEQRQGLEAEKSLSFSEILKKFYVCFIFLFILFLYFLIRKLVLGSVITVSTVFNEEFMLRVKSIPRTLLVYLRSVILPYGLHYYRNVDILKPYIIPSIILSLVSFMTFLVIKFMPKKDRLLSILGILWFFIILSPMLNITPIINEYSFLFTADHFLYLPVAGLFVVLILFYLYFINIFNKKDNSYINFIVFSAVLFICLLITIKQNTYFSGEIPLFQRTLKYEPQFGRAHILLSKAYYFNKQYKKAVEEDKKALNIMLKYARITRHPEEAYYNRFLKEIFSDMGVYYAVLKEYNLSIEAYKKALQINKNDGSLYDGIGFANIKQGNMEEAMINFRKALGVNRNDIMAMKLMSDVYKIQGKDDAYNNMKSRITNLLNSNKTR